MTRRRTPLTIIAVLGAFVVLAAACSGADQDAASPTQVDGLSAERGGDEAAEAPAEDAADHEAPEPAAGDGQGLAGDHGLLPPTRLAGTGRKVIHTGELELEVADPDATVDRIIRTVEQVDGFLATADLRRDDQNLLRGTMVVRVPADRFTEVLRSLEELADRNPVVRVDEQDVTTEVADLDARLRNLEAFEAQLRDLLQEVRDQGGRAEDLLRVFERIREVRAEIEQVRGRAELLDDRVAYATITVRLTPAATATPIPDPTWQPLETIHDALAATARALTRVADAAIWLALTVLPILLVFLAPLFAGWLGWRRYVRRHAEA